MSIRTDFNVGVLLSLRARFLMISLWATLFVVGAAWLAAQFSGRQPSTVALDVGLSVIRLILPVLAALLLQELLSRDFERRYSLLSLTYPRSRHVFLLGRFLAVLVLLLGLLCFFSLSLGAVVALIGQGYSQDTPPSLGWNYLLTIMFVGVDLFVVVAIGTLFGVIASTSSFVLIGTVGFALVARSYSYVIYLIQRDSTLVPEANAYESSLSILGFFVPDLSGLDIRMVALYGTFDFMPEDWMLRGATALVYGGAILSLAMWFLQRKRFS